MGFALFSSSVVRYRLYSRWGFSALEIAQIIAICNLSFWMGLFAVGGILFLVEPLQVPKLLHLPFGSVHAIGVIFVGIVIAYSGFQSHGVHPLVPRPYAPCPEPTRMYSSQLT